MYRLANEDIRRTAKQFGVRLWEIGEAMGLNDGNFSRKLRHELPAKDKERVLGIINQLASGRESEEV